MNTVQRRESRQSTAMRYINDFEKISDKKKEFSNMKARVEELKILQLREQGKKIEMESKVSINNDIITRLKKWSSVFNVSKTKVHSLIDQHQKFTHETSKILANILNSKRTLDEILECNQSKFRWLKKVAEKNLRNSIVFESHFQEFSVGLKEKIALLDHVDDFLKEDLNSCLLVKDRLSLELEQVRSNLKSSEEISKAMQNEWTNERESICNKKKIEVLKNFDEAQRTLENFQDLEMVYNQTKDRQRNENYEKNLLRIEIEGMTEKINNDIAELDRKLAEISLEGNAAASSIEKIGRDQIFIRQKNENNNHILSQVTADLDDLAREKSKKLKELKDIIDSKHKADHSLKCQIESLELEKQKSTELVDKFEETRETKCSASNGELKKLLHLNEQYDKVLFNIQSILEEERSLLGFYFNEFSDLKRLFDLKIKEIEKHVMEKISKLNEERIKVERLHSDLFSETAMTARLIITKSDICSLMNHEETIAKRIDTLRDEISQAIHKRDTLQVELGDVEKRLRKEKKNLESIGSDVCAIEKLCEESDKKLIIKKNECEIAIEDMKAKANDIRKIPKKIPMKEKKKKRSKIISKDKMSPKILQDDKIDRFSDECLKKTTASSDTTRNDLADSKNQNRNLSSLSHRRRIHRKQAVDSNPNPKRVNATRTLPPSSFDLFSFEL